MPKHDIDQLIRTLGLPAAAAERSVAAVLFSYRCSSACRHCCFGCAGDRPDVVMQPDQCVEALARLHETDRVIHIAGGEAMLYWDLLSESIRLAHQRGIAPHFIETNCSFAVSDDIVRQRFAFLAEHGLFGIYASASPYHQEHVPAEHFLRVRRITGEIFGERNFYGPGTGEEQVRDYERIARDETRLRDFVRSNPPAMVGTAQQRLAQYLDSFSPDDPALPVRGWRMSPESIHSCLNQFRADTIWELHVDPYGNLQTNCGMILGNISDITPAELLRRGPEKANRFVQVVSESGPIGLARLAEKNGFVLPERVSQGCELCYLTRRFLRKFHPAVFGPAEVYA